MKKFAIMIFALAGCEGTMQAAIRGGGEPVTFAYEQGLDSDILTATVGLETFKGRAVMSDATTTFGTGFGTVFTGGTTAFGNSQFFATSDVCFNTLIHLGLRQLGESVNASLATGA